MLTILDRQLIRSYIKSYVGCLLSLMGLFVIIDLFTNLDAFTSKKSDLDDTFRHIGRYYAAKLPEIFDHLCEAMILMAAMFTVAWSQKNNEILPLLSAGVSTRRIVRPVLFVSFAMISLVVLNQELVLPHVDSYLLENRNDPDGTKEAGVKGTFDSQGIQYTGQSCVKSERKVNRFVINIPAKPGLNGHVFLQAAEAYYHPPGTKPGSRFPDSGVWVLHNTIPAELPSWHRTDLLEMKSAGLFYLYTNEVDFDTVIRPKNWFRYCNTFDLMEQFGKVGDKLAGVAVVFHTRLTRPVLGMLLVFMGLSIILRDQNRNVFISAGMCLCLCALFFATNFACQYLGSHGEVPPAFAAWLPVLLFGPMSFVMFDAVHT
jgi:lipopolysaccharide export system permease protein